jgi:RNA polymerase sigma factor (sigma-70 family)
VTGELDGGPHPDSTSRIGSSELDSRPHPNDPGRVGRGELDGRPHPDGPGRVGSGELELALAELMPDLLRYFARRVEPREDAADCLSETMIVLWRRRRSLPESLDEQRAWAFGVAKRVLANQRRGRVRHAALADKVRAAVAVHGEPASPAADLELANDALAVLNETDRELVRLIVWDEFGVAAAGALVGLNAGAARMRWSRAKDAMRAAMTFDGVG